MTTKVNPLVAYSTKHNHAKRGSVTPEYNSWRGMIERCGNPKHIGFKYYGARGVTVCERWRVSFVDFLADMGLKPSPEHTLDRIDPSGNYGPENCQWSTRAEQRLNQRPYNQSARVRAAWDSRYRDSPFKMDITGQRFGRLTVLKEVPSENNRTRWLCRCICGTEVEREGKTLRNGRTKSCGCLNRESARERAIQRNLTDNPAKYRWNKG